MCSQPWPTGCGYCTSEVYILELFYWSRQSNSPFVFIQKNHIDACHEQAVSATGNLKLTDTWDIPDIPNEILAFCERFSFGTEERPQTGGSFAHMVCVSPSRRSHCEVRSTLAECAQYVCASVAHVWAFSVCMWCSILQAESMLPYFTVFSISCCHIVRIWTVVTSVSNLQCIFLCRLGKWPSLHSIWQGSSSEEHEAWSAVPHGQLPLLRAVSQTEGPWVQVLYCHQRDIICHQGQLNVCVEYRLLMVDRCNLTVRGT